MIEKILVITLSLLIVGIILLAIIRRECTLEAVVLIGSYIHSAMAILLTIGDTVYVVTTLVMVMLSLLMLGGARELLTDDIKNLIKDSV